MFAQPRHNRPLGAPFALAIALLGPSFSTGCGGNGAGSTIPPPPPPPPTSPPAGISVSFAPAVSAIDMGQSDSLTAMVTNDASGSGVTWSVTCPSGVVACGAMASATSASGTSDLFTAAANVSATEAVDITATSAKDPSKSASIHVTVNPKPTSANPASASSTVGQFFNVNLSQDVQGGTAPFTWSAGVALPAGLTLDTATGILSGTPSGLPTTELLAFTATDSGTPRMPVNVSLQLTINPQPVLAASLTPASMVLGCNWVAASARGYCTPPFVYSRVATLTNLGSAALHISTMQITGQGFGYSSACRATLLPGRSCAITIGWGGLFFGRGVFEVFDDAPNSPQRILLFATASL